MMIRLAALLAVAVTFVFSPSALAQTGLQVRPLSYEATLQAGQPQQGVVDVSNPSDQPVTVRVSVKRFSREGDGLQFHDDRQLASGIQLDQDTIELDAKSAYRLVFQADPGKLPAGDIRAAVLFTTYSDGDMVAQQVSVGTLLQLTNSETTEARYTDSDHSAMITRLVFGAIAVAIVVGVVAWLVMRRRKSLAFTKRR